MSKCLGISNSVSSWQVSPGCAFLCPFTRMGTLPLSSPLHSLWLAEPCGSSIYLSFPRAGSLCISIRRASLMGILNWHFVWSLVHRGQMGLAKHLDLTPLARCYTEDETARVVKRMDMWLHSGICPGSLRAR